VNSHSEYTVSLALVTEFDAASPTAGELRMLEACIPELIAALVDAATDDED
jgi:hypothetical protein